MLVRNYVGSEVGYCHYITNLFSPEEDMLII